MFRPVDLVRFWLGGSGTLDRLLGTRHRRRLVVGVSAWDGCGWPLVGYGGGTDCDGQFAGAAVLVAYPPVTMRVDVLSAKMGDYCLYKFVIENHSDSVMHDQCE